MRRRSAIGALAVLALLASGSLDALAKTAYAEKEGIECNVCHVENRPKRLTDRGLYYQALHTMDGYDRLLENFGQCTFCHVNRAGSKKFTKDGKKFRAVVRDMRGLFEWLKAGHTGTSPDAPAATPPASSPTPR